MAALSTNDEIFSNINYYRRPSRTNDIDPQIESKCERIVVGDVTVRVPG